MAAPADAGAGMELDGSVRALHDWHHDTPPRAVVLMLHGGAETSLDAIESAPPAPNGERVPAYIVLLSDGTTTVGTSNATAARDARAQHVPVETIAFGQQGATIEVNGEIADVSVDRDALAAIAAATRGRAFTAENSTQIRNVYHDIGKSIGYLHVPSDLTAWFVGGGIVLLLAASGLSLAWFNRLP